MHALWISLTCLSGVFAFAFLTGGILGMQDTQPAKDREEEISQAVDLVCLGGFGTIVSALGKNWQACAEERSLIWSGLAALAATILFGFLASHTA